MMQFQLTLLEGILGLVVPIECPRTDEFHVVGQSDMRGNSWDGAALWAIANDDERTMLLTDILVALAYALKTIQFSFDYHLAGLLVEHHQVQELILVEIVLKLIFLHQLILGLYALFEICVEVDQQRSTFVILLRLALK